jgi:MOSC domain-containing protein YiiM
MAATVVALHTSHKSRQATAVQKCILLQNAGLEGDRHAKVGSRRALLLMEEEVLASFDLPAGAVSEQVTVRGLGLHQLDPGARLRIGEAELEVTSHCAPCRRMDEIRPGLRKDLEGRRGRFARVVKGGAVAVGDAIVLTRVMNHPG